MEKNIKKNIQENKQIIKKEPKEWHPQHHHILKEWAEIGYSYRYLHDKAYLHYSKQNLRFALPVIIISTLTGTANFAQQSFPKEWQSTTPLIIGTFNLVAGLITTIAQFLRVSELLEGNRSASIGYDKFSRNIAVELSLPIKERELSGSEFITKCRLELDKLIEQSPNIPPHIIQQFSKKFKEKAFFKPNILDINPIEIYIDNDDQERKAIELIEKQKNIQNKILKQEEDMRNKILEHIKKEQEENENKIKEELKKRKIEKKQKLSTRSVTKNIDKILMGINDIGNINNTITPDTSDLDSNEDSPNNTISKIPKQKLNRENNSDIDNDIIKKPGEILNNISILIHDIKKDANVDSKSIDSTNISDLSNNIVNNKKNYKNKSKIPIVKFT